MRRDIRPVWTPQLHDAVAKVAEDFQPIAHRREQMAEVRQLAAQFRDHQVIGRQMDAAQVEHFQALRSRLVPHAVRSHEALDYAWANAWDAVIRYGVG